MPLHHKLRAALAAREWIEADLTVASGVPQRTVNSLLTGESKNSYWPTVVSIARGLHVSLDWLADDSVPDDFVPDWAWLDSSSRQARTARVLKEGEAAIIRTVDDTAQVLRQIKKKPAPRRGTDQSSTGPNGPRKKQ